jgi:molybdopterin-containing oxidoreductase family membrane subunit
MAIETPQPQAREGEIIAPGHTYGSITAQISSIVQTQPTSRRWLIGFSVAFLLVMVLLNTIGLLLFKGVGV